MNTYRFETDSTGVVLVVPEHDSECKHGLDIETAERMRAELQRCINEIKYGIGKVDISGDF